MSSFNPKKRRDDREQTLGQLPGEIAELICLEAEYRCFTKGIRFIIHSPNQKTVAPNHDEANIPTKNIKINEVMNPSPAPRVNCQRPKDLPIKDPSD